MKENKKILLLLLISGVTTGLTVVLSKYLGILAWVSLIPLVIALSEIAKDTDIKLRSAYLYGLFYFECFYLICFHWFAYLYPLDFTGLNNFYSVLVIIIAIFGLSFLQALFGGFVFVIYASISKTALATKYPAINLVSLPIIYAFYEFTQTLGWWGVPWGRLSLSQTDLILPVQSASLFGSYFVTALIVLVNSLLAFAIIGKSAHKKTKLKALLALSIFIANTLLGTALLISKKIDTKHEDSVRVAVIQGNYTSTEKWFSSPSDIVDRHLELTKRAHADGAELVIWAETALPFGLSENSVHSIKISQIAEDCGTTILVGAMLYEDDAEYNSIFCYNPDGSISETVYKKRHLVPFGEYVPMRSFIEAILPFMSQISMLEEDMTPGDDSEIFNTDIGNVGSLICFDSIYEILAKESVKDGAELIAISTNDSWFSDSAAIYMHNNQARLRAIECGRYVARAANTGVSSFITNTGIILGEIPPLTEGYLCAEVYLSDSRTLYSLVGNLFVYLCGISITIPFAYEIYDKKLKKTKFVNNNIQ